MENNILTFNLENKYLADALAFLGYRYYKYSTKLDNRTKTIYTFKRTPEFMEAFNGILELKKTNGQFYVE